MNLEKYIRDIPDFPKKGIIFKDITPLLGNAAALRQTVCDLAAPFEKSGVQAVAATLKFAIEPTIFVWLCGSAIICGGVPSRTTI